jgi:hypothetical protein
MSVWRVTAIVAGSFLLAYGALTASLYWLMRQPLDRFGAVMRHVPGVAMAILPFEPIWMRVRAGLLKPGDIAPDFDLLTVDRSRRVRIAEAYRTQPVVLIFGSYT